MTPPARQSTAGFSLLEVMVAMTLLGLIGAMAAGGIGFGRAAWDRSAERAEALIETRNLAQFLRRQLGAARRVRLRDGTRTPALYFDGAPDHVAFIAPLAAYHAPPDDQALYLGLDRRDGGTALRLSWTPLTDRAPIAAAEGLHEDLAIGVDDVRMRYFGANPRGSAADWHDTWTGLPDLPRLVEITVSWADAPGRAWPRTVIALESEE